MRARNATIIIALAALVGLVDAVALTWDHQVHRVDPTAQSALCGQGDGCEIARFHPLSEIPLGADRPGLPISLLAVGAYLAFLALALRRWRFRQERDAPRLILAKAIVAALYSFFLAFVSLMVQETLCKLCSVLYAVNFILLVSAVTGLGESASSWVVGLFDSLKTRSALAATVPMVATLIGGYALYAPPVTEAYMAQRQALMDEASALPNTPVVTMDVTDRPGYGPAEAPVHLIEFADFGCGHCRMLYHQVHAFMEAHPGVLRMSFVNYPLNSECNPAINRPFIPNSCLLASASECAHAQGKWAQMAEQLFALGSKLDAASLVRLAGTLDLSVPEFEACLGDPTTAQRVTQDAEMGIAAGVDGTPTFLLNGHRVVGGRPQPILEAMIQAVNTQRGAP